MGLPSNFYGGNNMKKTLSIVLSMLFMGIFSPAFANSIKWSMPGDSLTLDPHAQNEGPTHMVSRQVYEGLVTPGINMEILPQLAESWETTSADTWVFNIRKGVKFHDGSDLTASDIAFSINRAKTAPSDMVDLIKSIKSASALDDHTVQVVTDGPNPILLNQLTQIFVMSEDWAKGNGCEVSYNWDAGETSYCASNANGTGPFKITFREQDVRTVFEKNNDWWGDDSTFNVDTIELLPIANDATRVAALLSGEIDYTNVVPVQDIERIKSSAGHGVKMTPQNRTIFFGMDQGSAELNSSNIKGKNPFADKRVRLAMYHALDMEAIKDKVMRGQSVPAGIITAPGVNGHTAERDQRMPYDPEMTKKLLAEAGYPDGFKIALHCTSDRLPMDGDICAALGPMLARIGIEASVNATPRAVYFPGQSGKEYSLMMNGWGSLTGEASYILSSMVHTKEKDRGFGVFNHFSYSNKAIDSLVEEALGTLDEDKRRGLLESAMKLTMEDLMAIPIVNLSAIWAGNSSKLSYITRADEDTLAVNAIPK